MGQLLFEHKKGNEKNCEVHVIYRVALWMDQSSLWKWRSTVLNTPGTLFHFLKIYDCVAKNRLRVFFASSIAFMNEMLVQENNGSVSNSVTVEQFLNDGRRINVLKIKQLETELGLQANKELVAKMVITGQLGDERPSFPANLNSDLANTVISGAPLHYWKTRSLELLQEESGESQGGDHDTPYTFTPPSSMRQALAWTRLLAKVHRGEIEP
ncbi:MAG: hypothetical protein E6I97_23475 [Chloroflexi bacterium]|nr:MAG: hypothetical protein E6I97_23475 [Chloroflexota bacterium]